MLPAQIEYGTIIGEYAGNMIAQIMLTPDIDIGAEFGQFVARWNAMGGAEGAEQMNAIYQESKAK